MLAKPYGESSVNDSFSKHTSSGSQCLQSYCYCGSFFKLARLKSVSSRCICPIWRFVPFSLMLWLPFSRCNQSHIFCMWEDVLLPMSLGFCVLLNAMSAGNMACQRDDVAGSISHNTSGDILHPLRPCQRTPHLRELHTAGVFGDSSLRIRSRLVIARALKLAPKCSQSKLRCRLFLHTEGWSSCGLIGAHC